MGAGGSQSLGCRGRNERRHQYCRGYLPNVSFVDDAGHQLLADMRHAGAELIGCGPMMSASIEEIEETETELDQPERNLGN